MSDYPLTFDEFTSDFSTEEQCRDYLYKFKPNLKPIYAPGVQIKMTPYANGLIKMERISGSGALPPLWRYLAPNPQPRK